MIRTKDEILEIIRERVGYDTSDEAISFIEDVTDTLNDFESRTGDTAEWERKYNELDASWRKKYKDRFFSKEVKDVDDIDDDIEDDIEGKKSYKYEDLFEEKEDKYV